MNCFVTGASGFVGSNLIQELVARGHQVKVLLRPNADLRGLAGVKFKRVAGDLGNRELLKREIEGCEWCFHVAASYQLWLRDYAPMYATNVEGTRNVIEAAAAAGCARIVYTSTVGCIALPKTVNGKILPADEMEPVSEDQMGNHYKRSKWQAECVAVELAKKGLPVIIVNPSAPVGTRDVKPTPTGQMIVDFLNRKMPAYIDSGLNWVHVRDVAAGHILAAEKGRFGERYILGNADGNWTHRGNLRRAGGNQRRARAENQDAALGGHCRRTRERGHFAGYRQAAARAAGRRAHGKIQDVVQSGEGHSRTRPAANAGETGIGRCGGLVSRERARGPMICRQICQLLDRNWQSAKLRLPLSRAW